MEENCKTQVWNEEQNRSLSLDHPVHYKADESNLKLRKDTVMQMI